MDLTKMTVVELKALWLDQLLQIEQLQKNIKLIQAEAFKKQEKTPEPTAP